MPADTSVPRTRRGAEIAHRFGAALGPRRQDDRRPPNVRDNAKLFVTVLGLVLALGTLALRLPMAHRPGRSTGLVDALFTAVSAFSGTFAVVDTRDHWNVLGQLVILILIQTGGLGFMVGASLLLLLIRRGSEGKSLRDALLVRDGSPALTIREAVLLSRRIVRYTVIVEAVGAAVLAVRFAEDMPIGRALWHGLFLSISAFCNAGFDLSGGFQSLVPYQTSLTVNVAVVGLIQAGALGYLVMSDVWQERRWRRFSIDTRLVLIGNGVLLVAGTLLMLVSEWGGILANRSLIHRIIISGFQSVSARSAGFQTIDLSTANDGTLFGFSGLMFIGGAPGSTAGGIKLTVAGVIVVTVWSTLRGEGDVTLMARRLPHELIARALTVTVTMGLGLFLFTLTLTGTERLWGEAPKFSGVLFDAASALGSCGLSSGLIPLLSAPGKVVLCVGMMLGKVGPITLAYALQRRQRRRRYTFPDGMVRMG